MIVSVTFIIVIAIIGLLFLGIKMSESIKFKDIKILFFVLFIITIFTVFNLITSLYFYIKLSKKKGQKGPRGLKGKIGDRGDSGKCNQDTCRVETLKLMMINEYKKLFTEAEEYNNDIEEVVCGFFSDIDDSYMNVINQLNLEQLATIKEFLSNTNNYDNEKELYPLHKTKDELEKDATININIADQSINLKFNDKNSC